MNKSGNIRIFEESSHDVKYVSSRSSTGGTSRSMSFAEFIERLEEHASTQNTLAKKSLRDLARTVLSIASFGLFKDFIG